MIMSVLFIASVVQKQILIPVLNVCQINTESHSLVASAYKDTMTMMVKLSFAKSVQNIAKFGNFLIKIYFFYYF